MARNKTSGDNQRKGAVKARSQIKNPLTGTWTKRDDKSGKFMDVKADAKPFKGVRKDRDDFSDFADIQIVDPIVKPRRMKVETIRKAVRAYYK